MKLKKKVGSLILFVGLIIANANLLIAQAFNDVNHTKVKLTKYDGVDGTPFFMESWMKGDVKLANGSSFNNLLLKYNQEEDQIYYQNKDNDEMFAFVDSIIEFSITYPQNNLSYTAHYRKGYKNVSNINADSFYEVLADGKTQLLKKTSKAIEEHKEYGSSTVIKKFVVNTKYYLYTGDNAVQIKLGNKPVLSLLNKSEAEAYANKNNLNLKNESDVVKLLTYYNTI